MSDGPTGQTAGPDERGGNTGDSPRADGVDDSAHSSGISAAPRTNAVALPPHHDPVDVSAGKAPGGAYGNALMTFAVAMAAGPFLQAVAAHFGSRLAGAIDESTRAALRRFLRREAAERAGTSASPISLRTEHGWKVTLDADTPAEALAQLLDIHAAAAPPLAAEPEPRLTWQHPGPGWLLLGVESGAMVVRTWDASAKRWEDPTG